MASLVQLAQQAVAAHIPYVWGGAGPEGDDCSGLMQWLYGLAGIKIPRTSREQKAAGTQIPLSEAQPGDLLLYTYYGSASNPPPDNHVGMFVGNGQMIDAAKPGTTVRYDPIDLSHLSAVVHIAGSTGAAGATDNATFQAQNAGLLGLPGPLDPSNWPSWLINPLGGAFSTVTGAAGSVARSVVEAVMTALGPIILTTLTLMLAGFLILMGLWRMTETTSAGQAARKTGGAAVDAAAVAAA